MTKEREEKHRLPKRWVRCSVETEYLGDDRKSSKIHRKRAIATDRSKYKKTDRNKSEKLAKRKQGVHAAKPHLLRGRVLSITPQGIVVDYEDEIIICMLRGILKKEKSEFKNLVTVGDFVLFERTPEGEGVISHVEPRQSTLSRADNLSRRKEQLIAANIDQVIITVSVVSPPLKPSLVDRYVIATCKGGMQPVIVVNKIDLLEDTDIDGPLLTQEREAYQDFVNAYGAVWPIISASTMTGEGLEALRETMKDKASVFSGQSGVGKSSLINAIAGLDLRVGKIVDKTKKGAHTTTTANLLKLPFGGWCIDTPGIKSFGIWDLKKDEIEPHFTEIHEVGMNCKFPDCTHSHEKDCAVIAAVEKGEIALLRYQSYLYLIESISQKHMRR